MSHVSTQSLPLISNKKQERIIKGPRIKWPNGPTTNFPEIRRWVMVYYFLCAKYQVKVIRQYWDICRKNTFHLHFKYQKGIMSQFRNYNKTVLQTERQTDTHTRLDRGASTWTQPIRFCHYGCKQIDICLSNNRTRY